MAKADDKVYYGDGEKEKYTYFDVLQKRVDILQRIVDEHAKILKQNNLVKTEKTEAPLFDEDLVYRELEEEAEVKPNSSQA
jgi:hypothetical protein